MNRHFHKSLTLWLALLLAVRAMVPDGFMVMAEGDGLHVTFCPSLASPAVANEHAAHAGHEVDAHAAHAGHQHDHAGTGSGHDTAPCPFSLAASVALFDLPAATAAAVNLTETVSEFSATSAVSAGPIRAERIRGPPQFS